MKSNLQGTKKGSSLEGCVELDGCLKYTRCDPVPHCLAYSHLCSKTVRSPCFVDSTMRPAELSHGTSRTSLEKSAASVFQLASTMLGSYSTRGADLIRSRM